MTDFANTDEPTKQDFCPSMADKDPATGRLYRDRWALRLRTFRPSYHLDHDKIVRATCEDPAANATAAEIKKLIAALEANYRELGEKLKELKRSHPSARMPNESEIAYRKRVPQSKTYSSEEIYVLVWLASERTWVNRAIKALRDGYQPGHGFPSINRNQTTRALFKPFEDRWCGVYFPALHAEEAQVRAIVEATPIDDAAWEAYQLNCDYADARAEVEVAWRTECSHGGRPPIGLNPSDIFNILRERTDQRAGEITRARHAREREEVAQ
jgi:hypothetical protein